MPKELLCFYLMNGLLGKPKKPISTEKVPLLLCLTHGYLTTYCSFTFYS